jgi:hypothetical protein
LVNLPAPNQVTSPVTIAVIVSDVGKFSINIFLYNIK